MTKRESERREHMYRALATYGLSRDEAEQLRRISMTLQRWSERECNGEVEVDENDHAWARLWSGKQFRVPNREAGALRRLARIMEPHKRRLYAYHQGDPRGCALYIIPRKKIAEYVKSRDWSGYGRAMSASQRFDEAASMIYNSRGVSVY